MNKNNEPTHRLEFNTFDLLTHVTGGYQIISAPAKAKGSEGVQRISGRLTLVFSEGVKSWDCTPWLLSDPMRVSIFCRRQDQEQLTHVKQLKRLLEHYGVKHTYNAIKESQYYVD